MRNHAANAARRGLSCLVALAALLASLWTGGLAAQAAEVPTSLGLAAHGMTAYEEHWEYKYGGKGEMGPNGVRVSDCAGLIYSYFKDIGALGNCMASVNAQIDYNCVFSGDTTELEGVPRIHGLVVTFPDYNQPETGIYSHIGIYVGNNYAVDNSTYGTDMVYSQVEGSTRGWTAWHVFDNGTLYPSNGWYEYRGQLYHYTNCQYDVDTTVDGIAIGSDGAALDSAGQPLAPGAQGAPALSQAYVSATEVAAQLSALGYSGEDSTAELVNGGGEVPEEDLLNGKITGSGVRLRQEPTTDSAIVATLDRDVRVQVLEAVSGQSITANGQTTDQWYSVVTANGRKGYVCALYVEKESVLAAPTFSVTAEGGLAISAPEGCEIRYTEDGSHPTAESVPYTGPIYLSGTYRAIAVQEGWTSPMASVTFAGGMLFTDFTAEDWFFPHVDRAVALGLFSGSDGKFTPNAEITRAQFAAALANLAGVDVEAYKGETSFSDVAAGDWYSGAVNWVSSQGIMGGSGDGTFQPDSLLSREQMCVAIANYAGISPTGEGGTFDDDADISSWAKNAVYACRDWGLISGMGGNFFEPQSNSQRSQACVVILKAYDQGL